MKKEKWYSLLILVPMLILLSMNIETSLGGLIYAFPHHLINLLFILATLVLYPLLIFNDKKLKYIGLAISIVLIIFWGYPVLKGKPAYETTLRCDSEALPLKEDTKAYLENNEMGDITMNYEENIDCYCIHAKLYKTGDTKLIVEYEDGSKKVFDLHIGKSTYDIKEVE